jgi:hypothetical protein
VKKAAILTFHCADNFGAVLQAHALARVLEDLGLEAEILDFAPARLVEPYALIPPLVPTIRKKGIPGALRTLASSLRHLPFLLRRRRSFAAFRARHLRLSAKRFSDPAALASGAGGYDCYLCGSDQVWNPDFFVGLEGAYFLAFAPPGTTRIAYAPSIANARAADHAAEFARYLPGLDFVSVREAGDRDFVAGFTARPVEAVLDPSLLLTGQQWLELAVLPKRPRPYILVYDLVKDARIVGLANKLAVANDCDLVTFGPPAGYRNWVDRFADRDPAEFVGLFAEASFVVTSSFHGTAFALLFNRPFYTVPHSSRGGRMLDLLAAVGLGERAVTDSEQLSGALTPLDFQRANGLLAEARQRSLEYLKRAVGVGGAD